RKLLASVLFTYLKRLLARAERDAGARPALQRFLELVAEHALRSLDHVARAQAAAAAAAALPSVFAASHALRGSLLSSLLPYLLSGLALVVHDQAFAADALPPLLRLLARLDQLNRAFPDLATVER